MPVLLSDASACENAAFSSLEALTGTAQAYTAASGQPFEAWLDGHREELLALAGRYIG